MRLLSIVQTLLMAVGVMFILIFNKISFLIGLSLMLLAWLTAVISGIVFGWGD
ncbi:hypothetical protein GF378_01885 [Candidatus Pacearchaeota archaeon]|nr:hypothetical protein [Candidatus Pacearchaeota archaeon]